MLAATADLPTDRPLFLLFFDSISAVNRLVVKRGPTHRRDPLFCPFVSFGTIKGCTQIFTLDTPKVRDKCHQYTEVYTYIFFKTPASRFPKENLHGDDLKLLLLLYHPLQVTVARGRTSISVIRTFKSLYQRRDEPKQLLIMAF